MSIKIQWLEHIAAEIYRGIYPIKNSVHIRIWTCDSKDHIQNFNRRTFSGSGSLTRPYKVCICPYLDLSPNKEIYRPNTDI